MHKVLKTVPGISMCDLIAMKVKTVKGINNALLCLAQGVSKELWSQLLHKPFSTEFKRCMLLFTTWPDRWLFPKLTLFCIWKIESWLVNCPLGLWSIQLSAQQRQAIFRMRPTWTTIKDVPGQQRLTLSQKIKLSFLCISGLMMKVLKEFKKKNTSTVIVVTL